METMRRKDRQVSDEETLEILRTAEYGVLSLITSDGAPYGVPMSFALEESKEIKSLVFHSAREGRKLRSIAVQSHVHFVAVTGIKRLPATFATEYQSAMVEGQLQEIMDEEEKKQALLSIAGKYSSDYIAEAEAYATKAGKNVRVFRLSIDEMSGKALREKPAQVK